MFHTKGASYKGENYFQLMFRFLQCRYPLCDSVTAMYGSLEWNVDLSLGSHDLILIVCKVVIHNSFNHVAREISSF